MPQVVLSSIRFSGKDDISSTSLLKSSSQRTIRKQLMELYPYFTEELMETLIPKKCSVYQGKCRDNINLIIVENEPLFFQSFDGPLIPTLRVLHKFPDMMQKVQVDSGAIKFILSGADIMCPGLTSAGGRISPELEKGTIVAVMAEDKHHAIGIGMLKMSGQEIIKVNQGHGIESIHFLNDGLWRMPFV